ncbi:MAG: hypothetical protein ACXVJ2_14335, partial [Candidatus Angelobacter sp.]
MAIKTSCPTVVALLISFSISIHLHAEEYRLGEFFAGYSFLHGDLQQRASGWEISAGKNFNQWLSLHADFDAHHQSAAGNQRHQHDFLVGPQFSHGTSHFTLFVHALAGGCHTTGSLGDETGFASLIGGGIDWDHDALFSLRLAQVDFLGTHLFGDFQSQARFSVGVVLRFREFRDHARLPPDKKGL